MSSNNNNESKANNNGRQPLQYPSSLASVLISKQQLAEVQKIMSIQRKAETVQSMRETIRQQAINEELQYQLSLQIHAGKDFDKFQFPSTQAPPAANSAPQDTSHCNHRSSSAAWSQANTTQTSSLHRSSGEDRKERPSTMRQRSPPQQDDTMSTHVTSDWSSQNDGDEGDEFVQTLNHKKSFYNSSKADGGIKVDRLTFDQRAKQLPEQYPDGDVTYTIEKPDLTITLSESGVKKKVGPVFSWASKIVNGRSGKRKCLGIFICPINGCGFREKPRVPVAGNGKYSTNGLVPPPKHENCKKHPTEKLVHIECECYWYVRDKGPQSWEIEHHGSRTLNCNSYEDAPMTPLSR